MTCCSSLKGGDDARALLPSDPPTGHRDWLMSWNYVVL